MPDQAVIADQTDQTVYVLDADGTVRQRMVDPGPVVDGLRVIKSGLKVTDEVVIDGLTRVRPGTKAKGVAGTIALKPPKPIENDLAARPTPSASATVSEAAR